MTETKPLAVRAESILSPLEVRVLDRLDASQITDLTVDLVHAAGENPGGLEQATVDRLAAALRAIGAAVELDEVHPGRPNLVARLGGGPSGPGVLFLGHSDVVPAGEGWTGDPFEPRREGDDLIGRGTTDMKGGLAAVVAAMAAVHAEAPQVPMTLVCTVDEEADATGILRYIATTPAHRGYAACVVAEPTGLVTITGCRGAANLRVDVLGASAHAGKPDEGASAILAAADVIAAIEADDRRLHGSAHPVLGRATWNVGTVSGGHGTSIVPDRCTLTVDRRTLPEEDALEILATLLDEARRRVREHARPGVNRIRIDGAVEMSMPGFVTDPGSSLVEGARDAVRDAGGSGEIGIWTAACEGGWLARHHDVATIVLGPGDVTGQAHQPDERVSVAELHTAARAYALIAVRTTSTPTAR
jgi:acetylornithine deacetylase/succinyl-diaminopimelate desuccinylase-like protein